MIQTMMRKTYNKPAMHVEVFTPQEYCIPCVTDVTWSVQGAGDAFWVRKDIEGDGVWTTSEDNEVSHHIDPHQKKVYFTDEAYNAIMNTSFQSNNKAFYNSTKQNLETLKGNNPLGIVIGLHPATQNAGESAANPISAGEIGSWTHGGGVGVLVFNVNAIFQKSQS